MNFLIVLCLCPWTKKYANDGQKRPDWWIGYCAFGNLGRINIRLDDPFIPDFIAIEESAINTQLLEDARNNILPVYVWTVDDTEK